jgi:hypothetical protein
MFHIRLSCPCLSLTARSAAKGSVCIGNGFGEGL